MTRADGEDRTRCLSGTNGASCLQDLIGMVSCGRRDSNSHLRRGAPRSSPLNDDHVSIREPVGTRTPALTHPACSESSVRGYCHGGRNPEPSHRIELCCQGGARTPAFRVTAGRLSARLPGIDLRSTATGTRTKNACRGRGIRDERRTHRGSRRPQYRAGLAQQSTAARELTVRTSTATGTRTPASGLRARRHHHSTIAA